MRTGWSGAWIVVAGLLCACSSAVPPGVVTPVDDGVTTPGGPGIDEVEVQFLGTSGFLIRRGEDALLTDPFLTNPGVWTALFGCDIKPNAEYIEALLPDVTGVSTIVVGQGHYDHLMDVPYVVQERVPTATVYASDTSVNMIASAELDPAPVGMNAFAGDAEKLGEWKPSATAPVRVMALISEHAPQLLGIKLVHGTVDEPLDELPADTNEWWEGQVLAFVIDFLDESGAVVFRIHFQDSAANPPLGFHPPELLDDGVPVDLALIPLASFDQVEHYPEELLQHLDPKHVIVHHWDDFFLDPREPERVLRTQDLEGFVKRLEATLPEGVGWTLPARGLRLRFPINP